MSEEVANARRCSVGALATMFLFIVPTGCATRWNSSEIWLQSILPDAPAFIRQRYFLSLPIKNVGIERASEAPLAESTPRCASRGSYETLNSGECSVEPVGAIFPFLV
jgi:hypothetical protein